MAYPQYRGQTDKVHNTGNLIYGGDGTNCYPIVVDSAGYVKSQLVDANGAQLSDTARASIDVSQREPFIFRPGAAALANGAVLTGTRSSAGTLTSGTVAASTYWSAWHTYTPYRSGKIDGAATGGVISGQITLGLKSAAGTLDAKTTARIANTANTASPTTFLALSGTVIACTTAEQFKTYDIPYLLTDTAFNAVPFSLAFGLQTGAAATAVIGRIMESSYIQGEIEPNT